MGSFTPRVAIILALVTCAAHGRHVLQEPTPPSFILLAHDDRLLEDTWGVAHNDVILGSGARNPNGCRPPFTWFASCCIRGSVSSECEWVQRAYETGHEIATHTVSHSQDGLSFTYEQWLLEVDGQRNWTVDTCGIPAEDVTGFRAPYFQVNEALGQVLDDLGWLTYESSLKGEQGGSNGVPLLPGPLGNSSGVEPYVPNCVGTTPSTCNGWAGKGFWEVPAYSLPGESGRRTDPEDLPGFTILQRLQADLERKRGTGVPVGINVHGPYLREPSNQQQIVQFLQFALAQPNTWAVTFQQYIAWQQAGSPSDPSSVLEQFTCDDS